VDCFSLIPCSPDQPHESDVLLTQTLKRWAETEVMAKRLEYREDLALLIKPALHKLFVDLEMQKMIFPEECGGVGLNKPEVAHSAGPIRVSATFLPQHLLSAAASP